MAKLRIKLEGESHSAGRGVGFYRRHLGQALEESAQVEFVTANPDIIHYPFFDLFYPTLPLIRPVPTVVTIHDLTPLVLKEYYPQGLRAKVNLFHQLLSLKNVAAIITDSKNSQADINRFLKINNNRIFPIPLAVDQIYRKPLRPALLHDVKKKYHLPAQFILYVGGINANKNLLRLSQACVDLGLPLVFVGGEFVKNPQETFSVKKLFGFEKVHPELRQFQLLKNYIVNHPQIRVLGFVDSADLAAIYRLATLYCQPSLYEGFGLTLLEAMTCGCLIVSSNTSSLPEIYPPGTIAFSPEDLSSLKIALTTALHLNDADKKRLVARGLRHSQEFSWSKTAEQTLAVYRRVLYG